MGTPLRVLIVEDVEDDARLMVRELSRAGYEPQWTRVETRDELVSSLVWQQWDLVLADYTLPHFSAPDALQTMQQLSLDLPFIVVTGTVGEDVAVDMMKAGAHDYLLKSSLTRLPAAVARELREAGERRVRRQDEENIKVLATLSGESPHPVLRLAQDGRILYANPASAPLLAHWGSAVGQAVPGSWLTMLAETLSAGTMQEIELECAEMTYAVTVVPDEARKHVNFYGKNITKRKQAEAAVRQREAWFRSLIENTSDIILANEPNGTIRYISPSVTRILGYAPADLEGKNALDFVHPDARQIATETLAHALQAVGTPQTQEFPIRTSDGRWVTVSATGQAIADASGGTLVVVNAHDITERVQKEQALQASEAKIRAITHTALDAIITLDDQGKIAYWNPAAECLFGCSASEAVGKPLHKWLAPARYRHGAARGFQHFQETGRGPVIDQIQELAALKPDGTEFPVELSVAAFQVDGKWHAVGVMRDITVRKQAEQALRLFRSLVDHTNDSIEVVDVETGRILDVNEQSCQAHGYTRQEYLALTVPDIDPMVAARSWEAITQEIQQSGTVLFNSQHRRKDGSMFPVEVNAAFIRQDRDYIVAVIRDTTVRKQMEDAVIESRDRLSALIDSAPVGIVTVDRDHRVTGWNPAAEQVFGWKKEEIAGRSAICLVPENRQDEFRLATAQGFQPEGLVGFESAGLHKDGHSLDVILSISPQYDARGTVVGFTVIVQDVTIWHAMETHARRLEHMALLGQLMGGVAHEIKNPLFVLAGSLQLLKERLANKEYGDLQRDLDRITSAATRMEQTVKRFLDMARPTPPRRERCAIATIVQQTLEFLRHEFLKNQIRVEQAIGPDLPSIESDPKLLQQVFLNLILNAVQAMHEKNGRGTLTIAITGVEGSWIEVRVQDDGPGIAPEHRARLFEPFFSTKPPGEGTGLGLWTVRTSLTALGGTVTCETDVGKGATFVVRLPVAK